MIIQFLFLFLTFCKNITLFRVILLFYYFIELKKNWLKPLFSEV